MKPHTPNPPWRATAVRAGAEVKVWEPGNPCCYPAPPVSAWQVTQSLCLSLTSCEMGAVDRLVGWRAIQRVRVQSGEHGVLRCADSLSCPRWPWMSHLVAASCPTQSPSDPGTLAPNTPPCPTPVLQVPWHLGSAPAQGATVVRVAAVTSPEGTQGRGCWGGGGVRWEGADGRRAPPSWALEEGGKWLH